MKEMTENKKQTILEEANTLIYGDRAAAYGTVTDNFGRIAKIWEAILDCPVSIEQVGLCMAGLKLAREVGNHKMDNLVDCAGYVACIAKYYDEQQSNSKPNI